MTILTMNGMTMMTYKQNADANSDFLTSGKKPL